MEGRAFNDQELLAYLDELLGADEMAAVERELRESEALRNRLAGLATRRDQGLHSVGEIWRRRRLTCPSRSELGGWLLGTLARERTLYLEFHLRTIGCRYCSANLDDLERSAATDADAPRRRTRFFQSSAGRLPKKD